MPELCEVEQYRVLASTAVGRAITSIRVPDDRYLGRGLTVGALRAAVTGLTIVDARRHGKVLLLDSVGGAGRHVIGLRFGMTGRLLVDGSAAIDSLIYGPTRDESAWDRFALVFDHGDLRVRDARRLGRVELDPDLRRLGPDVLVVDPEHIGVAIGAGDRAIKAVLLDQSVLAGVGNLLADEILFRAGVAPGRQTRSLSSGERARLAELIPETVRDLLDRGGSHLGDLQPSRRPGGACPIDGTALRRDTVGGRTSFWCPAHQV